MSPRLKSLLPAYPGNTMVEYGVVASLVLLVVIPGLYLIGGQVQQWTDGVKSDMSAHRDRAVAISQQTRELAKQHSFHQAHTPETIGGLGHSAPDLAQSNGGNSENNSLQSGGSANTQLENGNTQASSLIAGTRQQGSSSKNNPRKTHSSPTNGSSGNQHTNNPTSSPVTATGGNVSQTQPSSGTISFNNGTTYSIPIPNKTFTGVAGTASVQLGSPVNSPNKGPSKGSGGNGKHGTSNPPVIVTGSSGKPKPTAPEVTLGNGHTYAVPTKGHPFTGVAGTASVVIGNGKSYNTPSPTKTPTQVAGSQARPLPPSTNKQSTKKSSPTKNTKNTITKGKH